MPTEEQLREELIKLRGSKTVIVGIGNTLKGDDGVGPLVCEQLRDADLSAELIDAGAVPENHIGKIIRKAPRNLIIIDAVDSGAPPGTISLFKMEQLSSGAFSTHAPSLRLFVDMIRAEIETEVYFVGVQPEHVRFGQPVSCRVGCAVESLKAVLTEIFSPEKAG
ncbi:MAG TPA: hydrogenase 3 maturation endopeptidase HyCI [Sedimentisphaerales bacterium]|nr:hydrogenase 3 maturation endopeptidase HyCI [Sedimentisphaerales bacterium]